MSYLATSELFRWQTGRHRDKDQHEHRLCGAETNDPKDALRAWTATHGNKLEEESRSEVMRNVWKNPMPKKMARHAENEGYAASRETVNAPYAAKIERIESVGPRGGHGGLRNGRGNHPNSGRRKLLNCKQ